MRKFFLSNSIDEYGLNKERKILLTDVAGLGLSKGNAFAIIHKSGFYTKTAENAPQGQIVGTLNFIGTDPYGDYSDFMDWILTDENLLFKYQPGEELYYCTVSLENITKTEISAGRVLSCPVTFNILSLWCKEESFSGSSIAIVGRGQIDSCVRISISSSVAPSMSLSVGSDVIGQTSSTRVISAGEEFVFSTVYGESDATINGESVIGTMTLSNNPFFRIPSGKTATLTANAPMEVTVFHYWRTV